MIGRLPLEVDREPDDYLVITQGENRIAFPVELLDRVIRELQAVAESDED